MVNLSQKPGKPRLLVIAVTAVSMCAAFVVKLILVDEIATVLPQNTVRPKMHKFTYVPPEKVKKLILFAYASGGSTVLGKFFSHADQTFYWFEPLHGVYQYIYGADYSVNFIRGDILSLESTMVQSTLSAIFNCKFHDLLCDVRADIFITRPWYHNYMPKKFRSYSHCLRSHGLTTEVQSCMDLVEQNHQCSAMQYRRECQENLYHTPTNDSEMLKFRACVQNADTISHTCLPYLTTVCASAELRTFKVIRLRMDTVEKMIKADPEIKVLFYTRDPRAILISRLGGGKNPDGVMMESCKKLCDRMTSDFSIFQRLKRRYSSNLHWIKYEALMSNSTSTVEEMYRFVGYDTVPSGVTELIDSDFTGAGAALAMEKAKRWRQRMKKSTLTYITKTCQQTIMLLNYTID